MSYYIRNDGTTCPHGLPARPAKFALRHRYDERKWSVTEPGDPYYGNAQLCAEEYFNGEEWRPYSELPR